MIGGAFMNENNNEKVMFYYPQDEYREDILSENTERKRTMRRYKRICVFCISAAMISFLIYSVIPKYSLIFFFLTAVLVLAAVSFFKLYSALRSHCLFISAYERRLNIEYISDKNLSYSIAYEEISQAGFTDRLFTRILIRYTDNGVKKEVSFSLNPFTPEQGFFLYTAPLLIEKMKINKGAVIRNFGTEEEYYERVYNGMGE